MFAIIETGGKQYKVQESDSICVEKLESEVGTVLEFNALMLEKDGKVTCGTPFVKDCKVKAEVVEHGKGEKIVVYKYKAKKNVRKKQGHSQPYTKLIIKEIC